jgi:integrase/recombinase XerC
LVSLLLAKGEFFMDKKVTYHEQTDVENTLRLRDVLKTLPPFCRDFFRAIEPRTTTKTRISYAYDIRIFFQFLLEQNPAFRDWSIDAFTVDVLDQLTAVDLEEYEEYLKVYQAGDKTETNGERGLKRKMSSLRSFYAYYFKREMIHTNPTVLVDVPKIHQKSIIRLEADEVALLLDYIEHGGDDLTGQKKVYYEKTKDRDLALVTLLLGTGVRVSECVGLDIEDVDFKNNGIKVTRKGGNEMVVYFGPEVEKALKNYLEVRKNIIPVEGHEHALFYSTQRKRIGVQAVENLVKKYARQVTTTKKITPHKLRSTYGTALYQETGDIYLVADVLGHKDVNTTKKHYAALDDSRRRQAATAVKLRED